MKKKRAIKYVTIVILIVLMFWVGKIVGRNSEKKQGIVDISTNMVKNEEFHLDIVKIPDIKIKEEIPDTKLRIKNKSNKGIILEYTTNNKEETSATIGMLDTYYLEKKVGNEWYGVYTKGTGVVSTVFISSKAEKITLGRKYDIKFEFTDIKGNYGLSKGKYKIKIYSDSNFNNNKMRYVETEFEIE